MDRYQELVALERGATDEAKQGNLGTALELRVRSIELARQVDQPLLTAVLYKRLGQLLAALDEGQHEIGAYETAINLLQDEPGLEVPDLLQRLREVRKAPVRETPPVPDLYAYSPDTATALEEAAGDPLLLAGLLIDVGNAYLRFPRQDAVALERYNLALERPELQDAPLLRAYALANRGEILRRQAQLDATDDEMRRRQLLDTAEESMRQALALFEQHDPSASRRVLALLAGIDRDLGDLTAAEAGYTRALDLYARSDDVRGEARTRAALAHLYLSLEAYDTALDHFQRALDLARQTSDRDTLWHIYWGLGRCYQKLGRLAEAANALTESTRLIEDLQAVLRTDEGKISFLESTQDVWEALVAVHLERAAGPDRYRDALAISEQARARALRDLVSRERQRASLDAQRRGIRPSRRRPASVLPAVEEKLAGGTPSPNPFEPDPQSPVQMAPATPSATDHDVPRAGPPRPVARANPSRPRLARLVFHVLEERTAVFAVDPAGEVQGHVVPLGETALAQRVAAIRRAMRVDEAPRGVVVRHLGSAAADDTALGDPNPLLHALYEALVAPVADHLPADDSPVVIEPHGPLWLLPFAALRTASDDWMADAWPLLYAPSHDVLQEIRDEADYGDPATLRALVVGNPEMPPVPSLDGLEVDLKPLPGAEHEAQRIAALFPEARRTLLLNAAATRMAVEQAAETHGIVHLATHGIAYADEPLISFVVLAEAPGSSGVLTAADVTSWRLPADLVTLSACQTGLGRVSGDGMIGLSRAFLMAGARTVLVSQWSVSDEATATLMEQFYRAYLDLDNKALALQHAMRALRENEALAHPRYWAPFIIVGAEA